MVCVMTSALQSNGVTRAYSKAVQIGGVLEAVTEEYDIKEDYDNKHGAPNATAPKIFMKYFFVNTKPAKNPAKCSPWSDSTKTPQPTVSNQPPRSQPPAGP